MRACVPTAGRTILCGNTKLRPAKLTTATIADPSDNCSRDISRRGEVMTGTKHLFYLCVCVCVQSSRNELLLSFTSASGCTYKWDSQHTNTQLENFISQPVASGCQFRCSFFVQCCCTIVELFASQLSLMLYHTYNGIRGSTITCSSLDHWPSIDIMSLIIWLQHGLLASRNSICLKNLKLRSSWPQPAAKSQMARSGHSKLSIKLRIIVPTSKL